MTHEVNGNMFAQENKRKKIHYMILKIGDKVYSTKFGEIPCKDINIAEHQKSFTKNIGEEDNFWIKGKFSEGKGHTILPEKIPFELNIYSDPEEKPIKNDINKNKLSEWIQ